MSEKLNDKIIKQLRGQLRQIGKEMLPALLMGEQYELLRKHVDERLKEVEKFVKESIINMAQKHDAALLELQKSHKELIEKSAKKDE